MRRLGLEGKVEVFEIAEVGEFFFDGPDLDFVEIAGGSFAVAGDEGDGAVFVEEFDGGDEAFHRDVEKFGDVEQDVGGERFGVGHGAQFEDSGWGAVRASGV